MDLLETSTERFLKSLGLGSVIYEPLGRHTFPDFSVEGRIGIECTELVDIVEINGVSHNATEKAPAIIQTLKNAIEAVSIGNYKESWFVNVVYCLQVNKSATAGRLKKYLTDLGASEIQVDREHIIDDLLRVDFVRASSHLETPFRLGGISDNQGAVFVISTLVDQVTDAMAKKSKRLIESAAVFEEWWLAVFSHLTMSSLCAEELAFVQRKFAGNGSWSKVLLINPLAPELSQILDLAKP